MGKHLFYAERNVVMKKDNQSNIRRERIIMVTSSALVLGALTLTGVYMRNQTKQSQDDGYTIDFDALENRAEDKMKEIAENDQTELPDDMFAEVPQDDLDYTPMEAGSDDIKIPGLTEQTENKVDGSRSDGMSEGSGKVSDQGNNPAEDIPKEDPVAENLSEQTPGAAENLSGDSEPSGQDGHTGEDGSSAEEAASSAADGPTAQETLAESPIISEDLHFSAETMTKPVSGDPLIDYSMNGTVYFKTLDQYKYNPAVIYSAAQGEEVRACTAGRVSNIYNSAELGHVLTLDLGGGYQAVYGQLENISVPIGTVVEAGASLGYVAAPTKYYSVEGSNLYFQLLRNGETVDPHTFF